MKSNVKEVKGFYYSAVYAGETTCTDGTVRTRWEETKDGEYTGASYYTESRGDLRNPVVYDGYDFGEGC